MNAIKVHLLTAALTLQLFHGFAQIADKAENISPLLYGEIIPDIQLTGLDGTRQSLSTIVAEKPTILIFYRGGWCPFCNAQLGEMQKIETDIEALGYKIIAISPDSPEELNKSIDKNELKYHLFSDADGSLIKALGIAFKAPQRYANMLNKNSGGLNDGFLPVPSVFVVDGDRTILFEYINPDYKTRLSSKMLMAVLETL